MEAASFQTVSRNTELGARCLCLHLSSCSFQFQRCREWLSHWGRFGLETEGKPSSSLITLSAKEAYFVLGKQLPPLLNSTHTLQYKRSGRMVPRTCVGVLSFQICTQILCTGYLPRALALYLGGGARLCLSGRTENAAYISHPSPHAHTQLSQSLKFLPLELLLLVEGFKKTIAQI